MIITARPVEPDASWPRLDSNLGPAAAEPLRLALLDALGAAEQSGFTGPARLDAGEVEQIGTASLQVLLAAARQLQSNGSQLILDRPSAPLREWARMAGVSCLIDQKAEGSGERA